MERVTRKIVQYLEDMEKKAKQMNFTSLTFDSWLLVFKSA